MKRDSFTPMDYQYPFGQVVHPLRQQDRTPKKVFVLGVYASAVHARWKRDGKTVCTALAVASEPRIFWDGNIEEAKEIISKISIPEEVGTLGYTRKDAWLCDLLPETRLNSGQVKVITERYNPLIEQYGLNKVTIPERPTVFCDAKRCKEILSELNESQASLLVLLGDIPIAQFLNSVADVPYKSLQEYVELYGYGKATTATIDGRAINVLPLAHPRQIGALGAHSEKWNRLHQEWENNLKK